MDNYLKGIAYEKEIKEYLLKKYNNVYLWNEIPLDIFIQSKIFENYSDKLKFRRLSTNTEHKVTDTGCDIFYKNTDSDEWIIAQCKNYTVTVTQEKLAGFYGMMLSTGLHGELYYTSKLSESITRYVQPKIKFINQSSKKIIETLQINPHIKLIPYQYQIDAYNKLKDKQRSILHLPCGMGKTLIAIMWAKQFDIIIIFSPLKQHAQQNLERFKNELDDYDQYILVDSDGIRDIPQLISKLIYKKIILSVTYKSVDVIEKLKLFGNIGIIIDEFHNLTYDDVSNKDNDFYKIFTQNYNYLFVSATPRLFDSDDIIDMNEITGKIEYTYEFGKAIQDNYICDYNVFVPDVGISKKDNMNEVYEYLKINNETSIDHDIKAHFLLRCMEENGHSKCISYSKDKEDAINLMNSLKKIGKDYHSLDLYTNLIVSDTTQKNREQILNEFRETNKKAIICSVRILDECIGIPKCDCIFTTSGHTNKIRMIQRMCRANRKDKSNPNKKAGIYMFTEDYNDMTELVANLKEFDSSFTNDKIKICNVKDEKNKCVIDRKDIENNKAYTTLDQVVINTKRVDSWSEKLRKVKEYINTNKKRPSIYDENHETKQFAHWISSQLYACRHKIHQFKYANICTQWEEFKSEYKKYFLTNEEQWHDKLNNLKNYIVTHGKRPIENSQHINETLMCRWIHQQNSIYKQKIQIMTEKKIRDEWNKFKNEHQCMKSTNEKWIMQLNKIKKFINENKRKPLRCSNEKSLNIWITTQQMYFKNNIQCIKNPELYNEWKNFTIAFKEFLRDGTEEWKFKLEKLQKYIDDNQCKPARSSTNLEIKKLGKWTDVQTENYKYNKKIMKNNETIRAKWIDFMTVYGKYFN